jgi:hypothetical protein
MTGILQLAHDSLARQGDVVRCLRHLRVITSRPSAAVGESDVLQALWAAQTAFYTPDRPANNSLGSMVLDWELSDWWVLRLTPRTCYERRAVIPGAVAAVQR